MIGGGEQYYRYNASEHGIEESDPQVPWKPLGITKKKKKRWIFKEEQWFESVKIQKRKKVS